MELSVLFCADPFIRELNRRYRGKDAPTDVLSFPQETQSGESAVGSGEPWPGNQEPPALGDIVISVETAARQARERGQPLAEEIAWLVLHGALHLLGYDDATEAGAREMDRRARRALEAARGA